MTDTNLQNKARAVVLSALMVLSVMVGTIALSGGAAAAATSATLDSTQVQTGTPITVTGTDDADNMSSTDDKIRLYIDVNGNGTFDTGEASSAVADTSGETSSSSFEGTVSTNGLSTGDYKVYAVEGVPSDDTTGTLAGTVTVDGTLPVFGDEHTRDVTTTTPTLTVPLTDANTSVNASTIEVDLVNGEDVVHQVNVPSSSGDGISYDASAGKVTIDLSSEGLAALKNGVTYTASVSAEDAVGNSNSTSFAVNVDTGAPSFSLDQPTDAVVGSPTQTIEVSIVGNDINDSTAELTITGPGGYSVTNNSSDTEYSSNTFTIVPGSGGVPELPNGSIQVGVSATDNHGNSNSAEYEFVVDNQRPVLDDVDVNVYDTSKSLATDENNKIAVGVDFNESIDASTVTAKIIKDDGSTVTLDSFNQGSHDKNDDHVFQNYTVTDGVENGSVKVVVTGGADVNGNPANLTASDNSTTFAIDTIEPIVTIDGSLPDVLEGRMDIDQYVSVSQANGDDAKIGWQIDDGDVMWFDNADSVDTRLITEGHVDIVAKATDENGTSTRTEVDVVVDNFDADVEAVTPSVMVEDNTNIPVSALVDVKNNGTEAVKEYGYTTGSGWTWADDATITVDSDTTYTFGVKVDDPNNGEQNLTTGPVPAGVFETGDLGIIAENVDSEKFAGKVNITVTSAHALHNGTVTVETIDTYYDQSSKTLSFDKADKTKVEGSTYYYTFHTTVDRDGKYEFSINSAATKTDPALTLTDTGVSDDLKVDEVKPELADADVSGATDEGHTKVTLTFSEPIDGLEASDISFGDASVNDLSADNGDGVFVVTFDREIQTGGDANLTISKDAYEEQITHNEISHPAEDDVMHVSSIELDLQKGTNFVSVPIEAGSIDIKGALCGCVEVIWTYEDGKWKSYDPEAETNELTTFEGGQGYIVYAKGDTELDLRGFTKYGAGSVGDENEPNSQAEQDLENGWNLIGHYQEGSQSVDQAFSPLPDGADWSVEDGTGDSVSVLESGEGYWLFTNVEYAKHVAVDYDGMQSERATVANVEMTETGEGNDDYLTDGETVAISADVADDSIITSVTVTSDELGIDAELTDTDGDGTYTNNAVTVGDVSSGVTYTLNVAAVDAEGNVGYGNGEALPVETAAPTLAGASNVDKTHVTVTINDNINVDESTIAAGDFSLSAGSVDTISTSETASGTTVTLTLANAVDASSVDVSIASGQTIADTSGNTLTDSASAVTVPSMDGVGPALDSASKVDDTTIEITLSDSGSGLAPGTIASGDFGVSGTTISGIDASSISSGDASGTVTINLGSVVDASSVDVTIEGSIEDTAGNTLTSGSATATSMDGVAPSLAGASKTSDTTIDVTISDGVDVDESTIAAGDFHLSTGSVTSVATTETASGTTVELTLTSAVDASSVDVSIASSQTIADSSGNKLDDTANAVTASSMDGVAPTLDSASATSDTTIDVTISDGVDVDESTIAAGDFSLSTGSVDTITTSQSGGTTTVTLNLASAVDASSVDVSIASGQTIADTSGNTLTDSASAVTATGADGVAPSLDSATSSTSGSVTTVTVSLSEAGSGFDKASIQQADFDVTAQDGTAVTISNIDKSSVTDGQTGTATVTLTLDGDYSTNTLTAAIISGSSGISDKASNSVTSASTSVTSS